MVLSGKVLHAPLAPASPAATAQANGKAEPEEGQEERGLAVYHEYLSFLFRKPDALTPQEQLEMQYRDYLQVWRCTFGVCGYFFGFCSFSAAEKGRER